MQNQTEDTSITIWLTWHIWEVHKRTSIGAAVYYNDRVAYHLCVLRVLLWCSCIFKPSFEKSKALTDDIITTLQYTELFGTIPLMSILIHLRKESKDCLPTTVVNILYMCLRTLNNLFRMHSYEIQELIKESYLFYELIDVFNLFLLYANDTWDSTQDSKELMLELLLSIGYFTYKNTSYQTLLRNSGILVKLCNMPVQFLFDNKYCHK